MPVDAYGDKWACWACIRGHRSGKCQHYERLMLRVRRPGRPLSSCPHVENSCTCNSGNVLMVRVWKDAAHKNSICMPHESLYGPGPAPKVPAGGLAINDYDEDEGSSKGPTKSSCCCSEPAPAQSTAAVTPASLVSPPAAGPYSPSTLTSPSTFAASMSQIDASTTGSVSDLAGPADHAHPMTPQMFSNYPESSITNPITADRFLASFQPCDGQAACQCGSTCECVGCPVHIFNEATREHVGELGHILEEDLSMQPDVSVFASPDDPSTLPPALHHDDPALVPPLPGDEFRSVADNPELDPLGRKHHYFQFDFDSWN